MEHQEALSGLMMANRATIDAVKREAEALRNDQIEELNKQHSEEKGISYSFISMICLTNAVKMEGIVV